MYKVPFIISLLFGLTVLLSLVLFYFASKKSVLFVGLAFIWMVFQTLVSLSGFYQVSHTLPPRFILLVVPPLIFTIVCFSISKGKLWIDSLDINMLTLLHIVRIPVELVLYGLFVHKMIPELMTFEGRNFDILSGITAPIVYYGYFVKGVLSKKVLLAWNFICLALLINIVANAILSAPSPFQQFAFDQPNLAVILFPFVLLPSFIVPLVLFSHLVVIRRIVVNQ